MQKIIRLDLQGVNAYLLKNDGNYILIDTGGHMFMDKIYTDRRDMLVSLLKKNGVTETNLKLIILTHGDNDHVCNAKFIQQNFHTQIAMHEADIFLVEQADPLCYKLNSNYQSFLLKLIFKIMDSKIQLLMKKIYGEFEVFKPDFLLTAQTNLEQFGFDGIVLHCPGHTDGSIAILDSQGNLISGDIFANNKKPSLAINAKDFKQMKKSAKDLLQHPVKRIYPGHGEPYIVKE